VNEPDDRPESWIETEEIRDPGADFGPGILMIGLALCILLLVALL
jgi:hypothetical protein